MVTLEKIRAEMRTRLNIDKELHSVDVHADTIDEALADAAVQLDTRVVNLQYEVIEEGEVKLRIRDCPFDKEDWIRIPSMYISPSSLTNYTITKSIDEVYTSFYAAVEGSSLTPEYFIHAGQTSCVVENKDKKSKGNSWKWNISESDE